MHAAAGQRTEALAILDGLLERAQREPVDAVSMIYVYVALGETGKALDWVEKGCDSLGMLPILIHADASFDPLRAEPRFQAVLRRMNLAAG